MTHLEKITEQAVKLIRSAAGTDTIEVAFSGGKDSEVILQLTKMAGVSFRAIHRVTTIDPAGTIAHCKAKGCEIRLPKLTFFQLVEKKGWPSRFERFCCSKLKEFKILNKCVMGVRRAESSKRAATYDPNDYIVCRIYNKAKTKCVNAIYPILNWSDNDVEAFIKEHNIKCHPLYYDHAGNFNVKQRLGCYACPLQSDNGLSDWRANPAFGRAAIKHLRRYFETHQHCKNVKRFGSAEAFLCFFLFCPDLTSFEGISSGLFPVDNWQELLEKGLGYPI